jgi:hypothetical protein
MDKVLMFVYTSQCSRCLAEKIARHITVPDTLFLVKVKDHPEATRKRDRESYLVVRHPRQGEELNDTNSESFFYEQLERIK